MPRTQASVAAATDVEVWFADLDACLGQIEVWERDILSDEERRRADRIFEPSVRMRFVTARSILRHLLGERLGLDPASLVFAYGPFGKPRLAAAGHGELHFNLSHADRWGLLAISSTGRVGVDLERYQDIPEWEDMALACFPSEVRDQLDALPESERANAFVRSWTHREAILKAIGWGWAGSALRCRAPFAPGLVVHDLPPPVGYAAAIAHGNPGAQLVVHFWTARSGSETA
jgi:4'-phosphopantetheinyl transferase